MNIIFKGQEFAMYIVLIYKLILRLLGDLLVKCVQFFLVYICVSENSKKISISLSLFFFFFFKDFKGISFANPHETTLVH